MKIEEPVWNRAENHYKFILSESSDCCVHSYGAAPELTVADISGLLITLSNGISPYFASPIPVGLFRKRLIHCWPLEEGQIPSMEHYHIEWNPVELYVYTNKFELHWTPSQWNKLSTIPPGFLQADEEIKEDQPRTVTVLQSSDTPAPKGAILGMELLEASEEAIPYDDTETVIVSQRLLEKRRVREARLRVAVARLKAERLAKRFYQKYGDLQLGAGESDSDLSGESEEDLEAYPKNIGSH